MTDRIAWELYRTFLAVLEEGSLSGAARSLGLTQPTVGRHISSLEEVVGSALFTRSQAGLLPTDGALALRGHVEAMRDTAASFERAARSHGTAVRGAVRVSASEVIGVEVLPPILAALGQQHPELEVELVLSNRLHDLVQREADIAVRMVPPQQDVLMATRIGDVILGLHAHPSYLERRGVPKTTAELNDHSLIGFDRETPFLRAAKGAMAQWSRDKFSQRSDSDLAQLALIRAGAGIGVCQVGLAERYSLIRVLPDKLALKLATSVTMHTDLRNSPRCRVAFDALVKGLRGFMQGAEIDFGHYAA